MGWGSSQATIKSGHERDRVNRTLGDVLARVWSCYGGSVRRGADVGCATLICTCSRRGDCVHGGGAISCVLVGLGRSGYGYVGAGIGCVLDYAGVIKGGVPSWSGNSRRCGSI